MAMVKVFRFNVYDIQTDTNSIRPLRATREAIEKLKGEPIIESCEEVDSALLDGNGFIKDATTNRGGASHG